MALLSRTLDDRIVRYLARAPRRTPQEIWQELAAANDGISSRAVYKSLRRLADDGVVTCYRRRFSLRLAWLIESLDFISDAYSHSILDLETQGMVPGQSGIVSCRFSNLVQLNACTTQVLLALLKESTENVVYDWIPHPWFCLVRPELERRYLKVLQQKKIVFYRIIGGHTFLDRLPLKEWRAHSGAVSFDKDFLCAREREYRLIVGDFIVTTLLASALAADIEKLFQSVSSLRELRIPEVHRILNLRSRITLRIERNSAKAQRERQRFLRHFGLAGANKKTRNRGLS